MRIKNCCMNEYGHLYGLLTIEKFISHCLAHLRWVKVTCTPVSGVRVACQCHVLNNLEMQHHTVIIIIAVQQCTESNVFSLPNYNLSLSI